MRSPLPDHSEVILVACIYNTCIKSHSRESEMPQSLYIAVLLTCLTGCGQTGPLYLPEDQSTAATAPGGQTKPASEESSHQP